MARLADLPGTAAELLSLFVGVYEAQAAALDPVGPDLPDVQYVAPGNGIPWDGEQVTVNLVRIAEGQVGAANARARPPSQRLYFAQWQIMVTRIVPTLRDLTAGSAEPDVDDLHAAGLLSMQDSQIMATSMQAIHQGYLFTNPGEDLVVGPISPVGPAGGLAGVSLAVQVNLK